MSENEKLRILTIGLDEASSELLRTLCPGATVSSIATQAEFEAQFEGWNDGSFNAAFCGKVLEGVSAFEMAQTLRAQCPSTPKFYVTRDPEGYEPRNLLKNGFTKAFLLPLDLPSLKRAVAENVTSDKARKSFRSVRVFDIGSDSKLEFDTYVFLPLNKKHVRFSTAGEPVGEKRMGKLSEKNVGAVFVDHKDIGKFYKYSADRMRELGQGTGTSATERQEKLRECVQGLFSDVFDASVKADFDAAKDMMANCNGIISNYVTKGASSDWHKRLMSTIGDGGDVYGHVGNVSAFAALFAIGVGHPNPEDLAMAGLFHDLGEASIPEAILNMPDEARSAADRELYYTHPEKSVVALKNKRVVLAPAVEKAILQHHEAWSGRGYPKQMPAARISPEAQILSFADQFDYLTRLEEGKPALPPMEAFARIKATGSINPELLAKIKRLLESPGETPAASKKSG